jgi:hypothetical protein
MFFILVAMIGWRHEVGGDWWNYIYYVDLAATQSLPEAIAQTDPAYGLLNWLGGYWGGVYFVNIVCGILFCFGLLRFCQAQPLPWLSLLVAIPYTVIVIAMGYSRQGVALGLVMLGMVELEKGKSTHFMLWVIVAALFHKSAVALIVMPIFSTKKYKILKLFFVGILSILLYKIFLQDSIDTLRTNYLEAEYASSGAFIRIILNALPALIFLFFSQRFRLTKVQKDIWTGMAWLALGFIGLLYMSPSSTAIDRLALYFIPLQLFVWSRLPTIFSYHINSKTIWIILISAYSALIQFVWLNYAENAYTWLPYKFFLLE